ncbi:hypothetical protein COO91_05635 [Nostoc flagelliforme CCNUN1]|uniref:Uncharacterized protein n=1 Tax=Nostoc flagelliforme CCNUN1 TaxID=2038116 RepID=A0A2K8SW39_9NOSO|nr:hypothetical protein COO91_05635 [Nostoc flagelliforme CCNUN1]
MPQGGSHAFKNQKSKVLWNWLFRDFKWLFYFRRAVLVRSLSLSLSLRSVKLHCKLRS